MAFKTKEPVGINIEKQTLTIKSAGEGADIEIGAKKCNPGGYWVKAFFYDVDKLDMETLVYTGELETMYFYPGDTGTRLYKTPGIKIVTKKRKVTRKGVVGTEFNLMEHTLKMQSGLSGDVYIGVDSSDISDQEAAGQIYIGGHQDYALRIGAFKVDWYGNVYVGNEIIHAAPPVVTKE